MRHGWGSGVPRYRSTADPTLGSWTAALPAGDASMRPASGNSCGASLAECSRAHNFSFLETATPGTWIYVAKSSAGFGQSGRGTQVGTLGGGWSAQVDHGGSGGLTGCCGHSTATTMLDQGGSVLFLRSTSGGENTYYRRSTDGGLSWGPLINAYAPDLAGLTTSAPVGLFVPAYGRELVWYAGWGGAESAARVLPLWTASHTYADTGTIRLFGSAGGDLPQPNTAPVVDLGPDIQVRAREAFAFTGVFTDPDPGDSWTGTVDFGDGGPAEALAIRDHAFTVTHTYAAAGTYVLTARIMDAAGAVGTDSLTVTVTQTRAPLIFVPGFGGSQLVATATRSRTITTSEGTSKQVSYSAGELIWLNEFRVGQTLIDPEFFDVLRFNDDGTPPAPNDFATNGELNRLGYPDVEATLREAGYVRDQTYFLFTYDFRFGAETWVQQLDDLVIRALVTNPGAPGVDIVAHSMGTLVTRAYLTNGIHAGNVRAAVLMGGPLLGTLQGSKAALAGQCLWKKGPICVLREQTSQYILRTLPGGLELGVSEAWYDLFRGQDREHPVAYVDRTLRSGPASSGNDYAALREAELARAAGAVALFQAEAFHEDDLEWLPPRSGNVTLVAGSGLCTIAQVVAYSKPTYRWRILPSPIPPFFRLAREFVGYVTAYDTGLADGDNTVLRQSASLSDPAVGLSASGGAPVYYRRVEHEELAGAANLLDTALPLLRGEPVDRGAIGAPTCTQVSTHSPVELLVTDDVGRRIGRTAEDAAVLEEVPLATYDRYLDMRSVVLNAPTRSTVSLAGTGDGDATIRVRWLDGAAVSRMAVFAHVPVTARSRGSFSIEDGARSAGDLTIDLNGDGTTVLTFAPAILDGSGAEDTTPPDLTVDAPAEGQAVVGRVPVSWTATDAGSDIGTTGAAIDLAAGGPQLEAPATVEVAPGAHLLDVFAEDRAGNLTTRQRAFDAYAYQWLPPLVAGNGRATTLSAGRTIPVRFAVRRADGSPVRDESVTVDLTDATGRPVVAPLTMGTTPAKGVVFRDGVYQADLGTKGVAPGAYLLRVRFDSSRLVGQLALGITLQ